MLSTTAVARAGLLEPASACGSNAESGHSPRPPTEPGVAVAVAVGQMPPGHGVAVGVSVEIGGGVGSVSEYWPASALA